MGSTAPICSPATRIPEPTTRLTSHRGSDQTRAAMQKGSSPLLRLLLSASSLAVASALGGILALPAARGADLPDWEDPQILGCS